MVSIDSKSCVGCGLCVKDCPAGNLTVLNGTAHVSRNCIQCGHCVAVCPTNSVCIPEYDMEDVAEYNPETFRLSPEHILNAIKFRRSIRNYENRPVEREKLQKIIEAGRYTETAVNRQTNRFIVVQERLPEFRELIWNGCKNAAENLQADNNPQAGWYKALYLNYRKNPERDPLFFGAPVMLAVAAEVPLDGGLASANMETMAAAQGMGVLVSGMIERVVNANPKAQEWLGLGDKQLVACMLAGYSKMEYRRTAPRRSADVLWK